MGAVPKEFERAVVISAADADPDPMIVECHERREHEIELPGVDLGAELGFEDSEEVGSQFRPGRELRERHREAPQHGHVELLALQSRGVGERRERGLAIECQEQRDAPRAPVLRQAPNVRKDRPIRACTVGVRQRSPFGAQVAPQLSAAGGRA
jgi:hypothetical protein